MLSCPACGTNDYHICFPMGEKEVALVCNRCSIEIFLQDLAYGINKEMCRC